MSAHLQLGFSSGPRVRPIRQNEVAECGLACLAMVASFHGLDVDLGTLRRQFPPSLRGATLSSLIPIADRLGFTARALKLPLEELQYMQLPAVLHWNLNHFVVLERTRKSRMLIHDPGGDSRWYDLEEVSRHFTGVALELRPADDFEPAQRREHIPVSHFWGRITGVKRVVLQALLLTMVMQAYVLLMPYYVQLALDQALPALDLDLLALLALGFGALVLVNGSATLLRSFVLLSAGTSLSFGVATNLARRLFRLPVSWFEKRNIGDVISRFQSIVPIQEALMQGAVAAFLDGLLALLTLSVMFFYSPALAMIAIIAFCLYAAVRALSFSAQRRMQGASIIAGAKEQTLMIESLRGIATLRLFNKESARHSLWQNALAASVNADVSLRRIGIWQQTAHVVIYALEAVFSLWLAIHFVIAGGFTVGMVIAYVAYKTQFLTSAASFADQLVAFRMLRLHIDRITDIAGADQDVSFSRVSSQATQLGGQIELRDVSFRYSSTDPLVVRNTSLIVRNGEHVAISGPSGGGKSTLIKILLGLVEPESGEVAVDGVPLARFGYKNFHNQIAGVMQDDHLFAGTIASNIALFDEAADPERMRSAARAAAIDSDITAMPMGYETLVGDMGSALSGGQKQRLLLARALYRNPRILIIDEGTSHLDLDTEKQVNEAISRLGITRIIVAHRPNTIAAATRVYHMSGGVLTEVRPS
jgi:ATP-binding cassette subfamily B protein RaxB